MASRDSVHVVTQLLSVNQTHLKHPTSTELLTNGTVSVKFNILLPSVLSLRLKETLEIHIKTCLGQYLI